MKRSFLLILTVLGISACRKDFLDRAPKGQLTYDSFFKNEQQAIEATNAVYQHFRIWEMTAMNWLGVTDILSDDADKGSTPNDGYFLAEMDEFQFDATNIAISHTWSGCYMGIFKANQAINNIPNVDMDPALRSRLIGEVRFLRALLYMRLVQLFGDVPIITSDLRPEEYYNQQRKPVAEVYNLIEADLKAAEAVLPLKSQYAPKDLGRATKGAAQGMLAKLYMLKKDFAAAEAECLKVINSNEYALHPQYSTNFLPEGENGIESVFEIGAVAIQAPVLGPGASPYNMVQGVRGIPNLGWGFNRPSDNLVASYEPGDPRRQATIIYVGEILPDGQTVVQDNPEIENERFNQKAWVPDHPGLQDNGPGNIRHLRYADVLLLAAEAMNENGKSAEALFYLEQIRKRARGANNFILPTITETNRDALRELIYKERRIELAMEQHRWFDLLRWGRAASVMTAVGKPFQSNKHELLPIPQTEIDLTDGALVQNPGY